MNSARSTSSPRTRLPAGRESRQARQGLSVGRRLRLVGSAGRLPLQAEPAPRHDDRRRRREHAGRVRPAVDEESRSQTAQRVLDDRTDEVQRRRDHHAVASRHPVGRAVPRLLRGQALQRLPGGFGHQPRSVPLRHRQGGRQGHHVPRCAAGHRAAARCGDLLRTGRPDHPCRTRRRGKDAGRHHRSGRYRVGPDWLVGTVSRRPATARSRARVWTGRARRGCTTTGWPPSPQTT